MPISRFTRIELGGVIALIGLVFGALVWIISL